MEAAVPEQSAGELNEAAVVHGLLVVADQDRPALLQPGEGALDDPAAGGVCLLACLVEFLLTDPADVRDVAAALGRCPPGRVVVGLVEAEVLLVDARIRPLNDDRLDRGGEQLRVVDVGAVELEPERAA